MAHIWAVAAFLGHEMLLNGRPPMRGEIMQMPNLARTFREVAAHGKKVRYATSSRFFDVTKEGNRATPGRLDDSPRAIICADDDLLISGFLRGPDSGGDRQHCPVSWGRHGT